MAEKKPSRSDRKQDAANPEARILELSEELLRMRFQFATRQLTNTSRIREVRREIARAKTLIRQQQLAGA